MENTDSKIATNIETNISNNNLTEQNLKQNPISSDYDFALLEEANQKRGMFKKTSEDLDENIINTENNIEAKKRAETDCNLNDNRFKDFDAILEETKEEDKKCRHKKCKSAKKVSLYKNYINDFLNEETKNRETDSKINENKNEKSRNNLDIIQEDIEKEDRNTLNVKSNENEITENKEKQIKDNNEINNNNEIKLDEMSIKQNNSNNINIMNNMNNMNNINNNINNNCSIGIKNNPTLDNNIRFNNYISKTEKNNDNITNTNANTNKNTNTNTNINTKANTNRYSYNSNGDIADKFNHLKTENNTSPNPSKSMVNNINYVKNVTPVTNRYTKNDEYLQPKNIYYTQNNFYKRNSIDKNKVCIIDRSKSKNNVIETIVMTHKKPKPEKIVYDSNKIYNLSLQKIPKSSKKYSMTQKNLLNNYLVRNFNNNNDFQSLFINFNSSKINSSDKNIKKMNNDDFKYLYTDNASLVNLSNYANTIKINNIRGKINNNLNLITKRKSQPKKMILGGKDILGNITANFMKKKDNDYKNNHLKTTSNNIKKIKQNIIDTIDFGESNDDFYNPKKVKFSNFQKYDNLNENMWNHIKWSNNFNRKFNDKYFKGFNDIGNKLDNLFNDTQDWKNIEKIKIHSTKLKSSVLPINEFQRNNFIQTKTYNKWFNY